MFERGEILVAQKKTFFSRLLRCVLMCVEFSCQPKYFSNTCQTEAADDDRKIYDRENVIDFRYDLCDVNHVREKNVVTP